MNRNNFIFSTFILFGLYSSTLTAQDNIVSGKIKDAIYHTPIGAAEIYDESGKLLAISNDTGYFKFIGTERNYEITVFSSNHKFYRKSIEVLNPMFLNLLLDPLSINLNEIQISARRENLFGILRLRDVEGTSINAGKKTEVVILSDIDASLALNNARQIYSQVSGLNIYQNDDAGLQLNIGGRGLDPNRTSNFNTRQNGYDISADVLGYPESYYTPPAEALEKIEIIRGASSLQYGTQFGGLVNFVIKKPSEIPGNRTVQRSTIGSNGLLTSFTSIDGAKKNISYYSFINAKKGNGFRDNSDFKATNAYVHVANNISKKLNASLEFTALSYLAKQAGGLNDQMFLEDPLQSNRSRNFFKVNWLLYNLRLQYTQSKNALHTLNIFALDAERYALGYRSNRVSQIDPLLERDLIHGKFNNYGFEYKTLFKREVLNLKTANLIGIKFYKSNNESKQGAGSNGYDADFKFYNEQFPSYSSQSSYKYPNLNIAFFGENIIYVNNHLSITPGFRYEYIDTKSDGNYSQMLFDGANNLIFDTLINSENRNTRNFAIFGLGISYKKNRQEFYANISQNYRSVTFSDMSIVSPAYVISPNIQDEKGHTSDIGIRGNVGNIISYDVNSFLLLYKKRIGFIQKAQADGNVKSERGNIGDARILGVESMLELNLSRLTRTKLKVKCFLNTAFIQSEYISSQQNGIVGNNVEFIPKINLKTGLKSRYKYFRSYVQFTYLSDQYTDASNAIESNLSGINGIIPSYGILDMNISYKRNFYSIESGINNILNNSYFTRRATGYPGPGIIPAPRRNFYLTLELKF
ncbi:MAG: Fe(3+) dicitrate transport protein FecA [Owenweeksia sp. TMED14]|nr:MAG: Fe(3+) dicitrate transport protein FecA [Owenweeksia sp. TMED14]